MDQHTTDATTAGSAPAEWPMPRDGVAVTHLLIVQAVRRALRFYADVLKAQVLMAGPPGIFRFPTTWLVLSEDGGPTDDTPDVPAVAPQDGRSVLSALHLRLPLIAIHPLASEPGLD